MGPQNSPQTKGDLAGEHWLLSGVGTVPEDSLRGQKPLLSAWKGGVQSAEAPIPCPHQQASQL